MEKVLNFLRQDSEDQQAMRPVNFKLVSERLEIFNGERHFIDALLERLRRADA